MGCDMMVWPMRRQNGILVDSNVEFDPPVFNCRSYSVQGFLGNSVYNESKSPSVGQWGLPNGLQDRDGEYWNDMCGYAWASVADMLAFDYEQTFEDQRLVAMVEVQSERRTVTVREFLGASYFADLERLRSAGVDVLVLVFCN